MSTPPLDRTRPPAPGPPRPFRFPAFERRSLPGGLTLLAAAVPRTPLLCAELVLDAGAQREPPDRSGLASFTAALIDEGSRRRSGPELSAELERLGAALGADARWDAATAGVVLPAQHARQGVELLAELAGEATFPPEEIERVRHQRLTELLRRRDQPGVIADLTLMGRLYGDSPYGSSVLGDEESVAALGRGDLEAFYGEHFDLGRATLIVTGDFDPDRLAALAAEAFAPLARSGSGTPLARSLEPRPESLRGPGRRIVLVDRPHAAQTELRLGLVGVPRPDPDFRPWALLSTALGGSFTSRLNTNLREGKGFTYGVSSHLQTRLGPAPFVISTAVANAVAGRAVAEIRHEVERLRSEPVSAAELAETRQYLVGTFPFTVQTIEGLAGRLAELAIYRLADDYFDRYAETLAAVTPEDLLRVARERLDAAALEVVAVGPAAELLPQLEPLGEVEVVSGSVAAD